MAELSQKLVEVEGHRFYVPSDATPDEIDSILASKKSPIDLTTPTGETPMPEGYWENLKREFSAGSQEMGRGLELTRNPSSLTSALALEGPSRYMLGSMQALASPFTAGFRDLGQIAQDVSMALGASPGVSAGLATGVELASPLKAPQFIGKLASPIASRIRQPLGKLSETQQRVVNLGDEFGVNMTAGQIRQSPGLNMAEAVPTRFPIGVKKVAAKGEQQRKQMVEATESLAKDIAPEKLSPTEAGQLAINLMEKEETALRAKGDDLYNAIYKVVPATEVSPATETLKATSELNRQKAISMGVARGPAEGIAGKVKPLTIEEKIMGGKKVSDLPSDWADEIVTRYKLDDPNRGYTYEGLDLIRKEVRSVWRQARAASNDNAARKLKLVEDGLTADMTEVAGKYEGGATALAKADEFYATSIGPLFTKGKFPRKLSDEDASQIVKGWIGRNKDHPERVELVMKATNSPQETSKIVRAWWEQLIKDSFDKPTGQFSGRRLTTQYESYSPEVKQILLGENKDKADRFVELGQTLDKSVVFSSNTSGTGQALLSSGQLVTLTTSGVLGLTGAATGNLPLLASATSTGAVALTPALLAKVLMSPAGIEWMTIGAKAAAGSPERKIAQGKILAIANALPKLELNKIFKSEDVPIEEKINAAMGRDYQPDKKKPPRFLERMMIERNI